MTDLQKAIETNLSAGYNFFDERTMEVWGTEIHEPLFMGRFFITSDANFDGTERLFSVREFHGNYTEVVTISFQKFKTYEDAREFVLNYLTD